MNDFSMICSSPSDFGQDHMQLCLYSVFLSIQKPNDGNIQNVRIHAECSRCDLEIEVPRTIDTHSHGVQRMKSTSRRAEYCVTFIDDMTSNVVIYRNGK